VPIDLAEVVGFRTANADEVPGSAAAVAKRAEKSGWKVRTSFARLPWITADSDPTEEPDEGGLVQVVVVAGHKNGRKFSARWHCKLWTKDGAEGAYKFAGCQIWPPIAGEVITTKAKKDRHPEHLGAATIGGLKNSKTMNDYLKEN
jgi:hypothetical protein